MRRLRAEEPLLPNAPAREVTRSIHEGARDFARDIAKTDAYVVSRRERQKVEMLFAHLKRILKLDRLRLRGPNGATDEFLLAATAQNLTRQTDPATDPGDRVRRDQTSASVTGRDLSSRPFQRNPTSTALSRRITSPPALYLEGRSGRNYNCRRRGTKCRNQSTRLRTH